VDPNNPQQYPPQQPQYPPQQYAQQAPYDPNAPVVPPSWGAPAPTRSAGRGVVGSIFGSIVGRVIAFVAVIAILGGGAFVYEKVANPDHRGQVIFTTTDQTANANCSVTDRVSTIKAGSPIYVMVMWSRTMQSTDKVVEEDIKDGVSLGTQSDSWQPSDYSDADCTTDPNNYSDVFSSPGTYEIKLTVGTEVVADGTLTVTP